MGASRLARRLAVLGTTLLTAALFGCGNDAPEVSARKRQGAVVVEACTLDVFQRSTLAAASTRSVVGEIILLCLSAREGALAPADPAVRAAISEQVGALRSLGYRVLLGIRAQDERGVDLTPSRVGALLANPAQRNTLTQGAVDYAQISDGIVVALPTLNTSSERDVTAWLDELARAVPSGQKVGLFAPPSAMNPSDIPGADAINLAAVRSSIEQTYLMTVDLHCCDDAPGPTTEADWIAEVVELAQSKLGTKPVRFTLPLYGTAFGADGQRPVTYLEAVGLASQYHIQILRTEAGALHFSYVDPEGVLREVWFDDAQSSLQLLNQLDESVPSSTGVLFYGLGAEDPDFFAELSRRMRE